MAVADSGTKENHFHQTEESGDTSQLQCLQKIIRLIEAGEIDLSQGIVGLPLHPGEGRFKYTPLSKRTFRRTDSNPTYKVTYDSLSFVVRMKPPGLGDQLPPRVCVEYEVISYVYRMGLPVPKPYYLERSADVIGTEFFIMEFVDGITIDNHSLPGFQPEQRRMVYYSVMETLARLHRLPLGELGLLLDPNEAYDDMTAFWNGQITKQEEIFKATYSSLGNKAIQELFCKIKKLPAPLGRAKCILHHSLYLDNFLFDKKTFKVKVLIDWEMCCVGDPLVDLAQSTLPFIRLPREKRERLKEKPELAWMVADPEVPGIPTEDELIAHYKRHSGMDFTECELKYAKAVNCLRFVSAFEDPNDAIVQHGSMKSNSREIVEFLTEMANCFCSQY